MRATNPCPSLLSTSLLKPLSRAPPINSRGLRRSPPLSSCATPRSTPYAILHGLQCRTRAAWRVPPRSPRGPVVRQLGNGRAVSSVSRLVGRRLRSTRAQARASTRARTPTMHTPEHNSMILHKHDTSTILHLQTDMSTPQRRERARRTPQGTARRGAAERATSRAAARPTTTST